MAIQGWLKELLKHAGLGALVGGATGAAVAPEGQRGPGALGGAVVGAGLAGSARGALGGAKAIADIALPTLISPNARKQAMREIGDILVQEGSSPAQLRESMRAFRLNAPGLEPTMADVGGSALRGRAEQAVTQPIPERRIAAEALQTRLKGMKPRISTAIQDTLSPTTDATDEINRLQALKRRDADAQYGLAYKMYPDMNQDELKSFIPALQDFHAFDDANDIAKANEEPPVDINNMSLRDWDLVKRGLDQKINVLENKEGKATLAGSLKGLRARFLDTLDNLTNGDYATARSRFHEISTTQDAIDQGRQIVNMKPGAAADVSLNNYNRLAPSDKEAFRIGVGRGIQDLVDQGKEGIGLVRNLLDTKGERLQKLFPDQQSWTNFRNRLQAEADAADLSYDIMKGSQTARRQAGAEAASDISSNVGDLMALTRSPMSAANIALRRMGVGDIGDAKASELVKILLSPNASTNAENFNKLETYLNRQKLKNTAATVGLGTTTIGIGAGTGAVMGDLPPNPDVSGENGYEPTIPIPPPSGQGDQQPPGYAKGGKIQDPQEILNDIGAKLHDIGLTSDYLREAVEEHNLSKQLTRTEEDNAAHSLMLAGRDVYPDIKGAIGPYSARMLSDALDVSGLGDLGETIFNDPVDNARRYGTPMPDPDEYMRREAGGIGSAALNFGPLGALSKARWLRLAGLGTLLSQMRGDAPIPEQVPPPGVRAGGI